MTTDKNTKELVAFGKLPPYDSCTPEAAIAAVDAVASEALLVAEKIATQSGPTDWDNTIGAIDKVIERMNRECFLVSHMQNVANTPGWYEANEQCIAKAVQAADPLCSDKKIYERLCALRKQMGDRLLPNKLRILNNKILDFEFLGSGLKGEKYHKFIENEQMISKLFGMFNSNIKKANVACNEVVTDDATLRLMPQQMRDAAVDGNKWRFSPLDQSYDAYMAHGLDRDLREYLYRKHNARASDLDQNGINNIPLLLQIHHLCWEQAKILGFASPIAMFLSQRMVKDPSELGTFLTQLSKKVKAFEKDKIFKFADFARERYGITELQPWDTSFIQNRYCEETIGLTKDQIRSYFGVEQVLEGLFNCVKNLFGVCVTQELRAPVWDEKVVCLEVKGVNNELIGYLYLDLFAKSNSNGAWAKEAQVRYRNKENYQLPTVLVNCNFTDYKSENNPRIDWFDVVNLFHEVGHALHILLSKSENYFESPNIGVEKDAIEFPSQFMENFVWRPKIAVEMSKHEISGEKMPDEIFAKIKNTRLLLSNQPLSKKVSYALYKFRFYSEREIDPVALWHKVRDESTAIPYLQNDRSPCAFFCIGSSGHLISDHDYLWAEVLSADAYEMFEENHADNEKLGRKFVKEVLERGATRNSAHNFRALRGRAPDPEALFRRYSL